MNNSDFINLLAEIVNNTFLLITAAIFIMFAVLGYLSSKNSI